MDNLVLVAFATVEGFYKLHSRPQRNHNPLDLVYCDQAIHYGATGTDGRFAVFPNDVTGFIAGRNWLSVTAHFTSVDPKDGRPNGPSGYLIGGYLGATFAQVVHRFAPPNENDTTAYLTHLCDLAKVAPSTILTAELLR